MSNSRIGRGVVAGSVLAGVSAEEVQCDGAVLVNVTAKRINVAKGCIVYNVATSGDIELLTPGEVLTTALLAEGEVTLRGHMDLDGGKVWKGAVLGNRYSFEQIYDLNADTDVSAMEAIARDLHEKAAASLIF